MENNDQKKTVELTTLPNTEVFGLLNCMVKPDSIIDDIEKRTRKFSIHPFYDDIAMVGVMLNPIYKLNSGNEIVQILCKYSDLSVKYINKHDVDPNEVLLDYILTNPAIEMDGAIQYVYGDSNITINKNLLTTEQPSMFVTSVLNTIKESDLGYANHLQIGTNVQFISPVINADKLPTCLDIYLNDKHVCTMLNATAFMQRLYGLKGINLACLLPYNSIDLSDILNSATPLNVKISGSTNEYSSYKKIITVMYDTSGTIPKGEFTNIIYKCGDVTRNENGMESGNIQCISSDNDDDIIEFEFVAKDPAILSKYKYVATQITRFNVTDDNKVFPEYDSITNNPNFFKYCIVFDTEITNNSIKCRIPNKFIKNINFLHSADGAVFPIGLITADGIFTTEKPNTP